MEALLEGLNLHKANEKVVEAVAFALKNICANGILFVLFLHVYCPVHCFSPVQFFSCRLSSNFNLLKRCNLHIVVLALLYNAYLKCSVLQCASEVTDACTVSLCSLIDCIEPQLQL